MKQSKILLIGIGLAGMMFPAWAQYENITVGDSCSYFGESMPYQVASFPSDAEAEQIVKDILGHYGLSQNFEIRAADVPNAAAVIHGDKRYILYNPRFMKDMQDKTDNKWVAISIMAHEIGHHLNGHTLGNAGSRPSTELAADEYSGAVIHKLGGSLHDARVALKIFGSKIGSPTHPSKSRRLEAVVNGYFESENISFGIRGEPDDIDMAIDSRCESEGEWMELDEIKYDARGYVLDGKRCGGWTIKYSNGCLLDITYKSDKRHGRSRYECEFENYLDVGDYKNDKKEGYWATISTEDDGTEITAGGDYKNDKKHGDWHIQIVGPNRMRHITKTYEHGSETDSVEY